MYERLPQELKDNAGFCGWKYEQRSGSRTKVPKTAIGRNADISDPSDLTYPISPLLDMVDDGKIAMRPAVELSYLPENEQTTLHETMGMEDCTPSHAQAIKMRKFSEEGKLNENVILSIMQEEKPKGTGADTERPHQQVFLAGDARENH
ncbi:hypothetical protein SAMN05216515_1741 [Eubacterium pyruvativorans]|uniref:Uncharacterized protein n=1 Tax=Eubacterium pyruvativorans TaxID=155865 RepID=A0A1I7IQY0_9FIRM|nr:hypothetical protein SAMN05216515_1741 [Eubacterium pyruvativorans]SFU75307.1 hypothetical protein SAMN05216508_1711 [Eubacterium pyruvativorans]